MRNRKRLMAGAALLTLVGQPMPVWPQAPTAPGDSAATPYTHRISQPEVRQFHTREHRYLIRLLSAPTAIPYRRYFELRLAVYDARAPTRPLTDTTVKVTAGMRHGSDSGFSHTTPSTPRVAGHLGVYTVSGMYFDVRGPWTVKVSVQEGGQVDAARFELFCCAP